MRVAVCGPVQIDRLVPHLPALPAGMVLPPGRGGTAVTQVALGLLEAGCHVDVVTLDHRVEVPTIVTGGPLTLRVGPYRSGGRARDGFRDERGFVTAALVAAGSDVVHAHWTYEYALGALATGAPTVVTVRDWAPTILRFHPDPYRLVRFAMNLVVLGRAPVLTATSPYIAERLRRWRRPVAALVPNAVDDAVFTERRRAPDPRAPVLVAANDGFSARKNVGALLEAFAGLLAEHPGARLRLLGRDHGPDGAAATWARQRSLDRQVEFVGPVPHDEVFAHLREADLLVHPAREESFGNVLVEAMSQGLPVVGGRGSGAVPWVLDGGRAGELTDVERPEALRATISAIITDEARWWELSRRGARRAHDTFRRSVTTAAYLQVYERAAERRSVR